MNNAKKREKMELYKELNKTTNDRKRMEFKDRNKVKVTERADHF